MKILDSLSLADLGNSLEVFFTNAGEKIQRLNAEWNPEEGSPVFTIKGKYTSKGWTEWTQGFQFGCQILQFDASGDESLLKLGRENTLKYMAPHVSHIGVHDHGFNNVSTYGNLRRLALEGKIDEPQEGLDFYELALKVSGAVQAARWSRVKDGTGYIHSFNGPHSLFSDTVRSCRALVYAHHLGHFLMGEGDEKISLLGRTIEHMQNTKTFNVYFGEGRDEYDIRGRVVHEGIFNTKDGNYRCPSTQQGYSPFTTWTRGLSWVVTGFAEQIEFFAELDDSELEPFGGRDAVYQMMLETAKATCDFYIDNTAKDGIPYWDTGAPGLAHMPNHLEEDSQPDNPYEPVDSSAAAITAQGLLRLGEHLGRDGEGRRYFQAGLTVAKTLLSEPYATSDPEHHGLLLHSVYHRPNGWDYIPPDKKVPYGEASMWGDYHMIELAVYLKRLISGESYLTFYK